MHICYFFLIAISYMALCVSSSPQPLLRPDPLGQTPYSHQWNQWKQMNNKHYNSALTEKTRFEYWMRNMQHVHEHNKLYRQGISSYSQTLNEHGDLPFQIFSTERLGSISRTRKPSAFDWTERGAVTSVKDQKRCGCGWAFAVVGAHEGKVFLDKGQLMNLSAQQLLDCAPGASCLHGSTLLALNYISHHGLTNEDQYPYNGVRSQCNFAKEMSVIDDNIRFSYIRTHTEHELKAKLLMSGPISVNIHVTKNFVFYQSGIFKDYDCLGNIETNHAVLLVGYGTDPQYGDYWLIKNSWGIAWGIGGYAKVARNTRYNCGIATAANFLHSMT